MKTNMFYTTISKMVLFNVLALIIFGYGFQLIRIPPSGVGLPLAELLLFFSMFLFNPLIVSARLNKVLPIWVCYGWIVYGLVHMFFALEQYGFRAIRQSSPIYEVLFLYIGYAFSMDKGFILKYDRLLRYAIPVLIFYALTFPFKDIVVGLSPSIPSSQGISSPIIGNYSSTPIFMVVMASISLREYLLNDGKKNLVYAALLLGLAIVFFPSRTLILEIFAVLILSTILFGRLSKRRIIFFYSSLFLGLLVVSFSGFLFSSRLGSNFQLSDYWILAKEIIGVGDQVKQLSSGNEQRYFYWANIISRWSDSIDTIIFGMGYGVPLIEFFDKTGALVTEPHNSFVSVLGRGGIIGITLFLLFKGFIFRILYTAVRSYKTDPEYANLYTFVLFLFICMIINALGEAPYVSPYLAVPYYFSVGVALRAYYYRKVMP